MEIIKEQTAAQSAMIHVKIVPGDYESRVETVLKDYRRKAKIPGFRPGMVPSGIVRKMYGKYVLAEEVSKLVSESLSEYFSREQIHILGDPLPEPRDTNWEQETEFEFVFEVGLAPEVSVDLSTLDKLTSYTIEADDKILDTYVQSYARRFGAFTGCDSVAEGKEMIKGLIEELDEQGQVLANGVRREDAPVYLEFLKDEESRKQFMGAKAGDALTLEVRKAFPNDVELASMLGVKKEQVPSLSERFRYTIGAVSLFVPAPVNQELFDKAFGEGKITSEEEFMARIRQEAEANLSSESEYKFRMDAKEKLLEKTNLSLPEAFLMKWLEHSHEGKYTREQIEAEFPAFARDLRWQLIVGKITRDNDMKVEEQEILDFARQAALRQFRQYGIQDVPAEYLDGYARNMLSKEEDARRMVEQLYEDKVLALVREKAPLKTKKVSQEEFEKLLA